VGVQYFSHLLTDSGSLIVQASFGLISEGGVLAVHLLLLCTYHWLAVSNLILVLSCLPISDYDLNKIAHLPQKKKQNNSMPIPTYIHSLHIKTNPALESAVPVN
jgi:hypothetical protein